MSTIRSSPLFETPTELPRAIRQHWGLFLAEGIILTLLGIGAILIPPLAGILVTVVLGWLFFVAGILGLATSYGARNGPAFGWSLASGLVALIAGATLLWSPLAGLETLTFVLTGYFIIDGVATILIAGSHRGALSGRWEWMMINGVVDLVLAGIIITGLPGTLDWVLGLLVGIDMIFGGGALIAMALAAREPA